MTPCRSIHIFMAIGFYRLPPWRTEKRNERTFSTGGCRCPSCRYGNTLPRQSRCGSALPMACGMLRFRYFSDFSGGTGAKAGLRPAKNSRAVRCGISSGMRRVCGFSGRYGSGGYLTERYTPKPRMSFSTRCLSCGSGTAESSGVKSSSSNSPANAVKML